MEDGSRGALLREVGRLSGPGTVAGLAEGELLARFVARGDEAAFEAILTRHGPMVLGVCRRRLGDPHDVDDAFQATFLVLARRASAIRPGAAVGPWLHGVARRVAARAGAEAQRRRTRERGDDRAVQGAADLGSPGEPGRMELRWALDEELGRLPETYRAPIVLCYLEGRTHDEAAAQLGWPVGTVRGRLARARDRLRGRLIGRGLAPAGGAMALLGDDAFAAAARAVAASATVPLVPLDPDDQGRDAGRGGRGVGRRRPLDAGGRAFSRSDPHHDPFPVHQAPLRPRRGGRRSGRRRGRRLRPPGRPGRCAGRDAHDGSVGVGGHGPVGIARAVVTPDPGRRFAAAAGRHCDAGRRTISVRGQPGRPALARGVRPRRPVGPPQGRAAVDGVEGRGRRRGTVDQSRPLPRGDP